MTGPALVALFAEHGGVASVHTVPAACRRTGRRGWQNVLVCADGFRRSLTLAEEAAYVRAMDKQ